MKTTYRQLTLVQRYQIEALLGMEYSQAEIARQVGCHRSTVSRELARCPARRYWGRLAQRASDQRRREAHKATKQTPSGLALLRRCLNRSLSPEMVAHRFQLERGEPMVSTATLYRWIKADWAAGGALFLELQRAHRPYRRRYGLRAWRCRYEGRRPIKERPLAAETRSRIGDWEGDTVYGKKGHYVTLVDRRSRYYLARKVLDRTAKVTTDSVVAMLRGQPCHTLTVDNGVELTEKAGTPSTFFGLLRKT